MRTHLPSTERYFQPFKDCVTNTIQATTSVLELTELLKKTLPGDQFTLLDPNTQQSYAASFGQWLIARINILELAKAKQQVINEIIGRIYSIIVLIVPKSKLITMWDVQVAIISASYLTHFFQTVGDAAIKESIAYALAGPAHLPTEISSSTFTAQTVPLTEEYIVGLKVAQAELAKLYTIDAAQNLILKYNGISIEDDISQIIKDSRYYDVTRTYNTVIGTFRVWFTTVNLLLGAHYYCSALFNTPSSVLMTSYFIGTDLSPHPIGPVVGAPPVAAATSSNA